MATLRKTSRRNVTKRRARSSSKAAHAPPPPGEIARFLQQWHELSATVERLLLANTPAVTRAMQRSQRSPLPEYARVVAVGEAEEVADVRGATGIVLDAQLNDGARTYTVYFPAKQETYVVHESSLWDTGETIPQDVIYGGGKTVRVRVDDGGIGRVIG